MDYEYEINLLDLAKYILKRWKVILICMLALAVALCGYAFVKTKTYNRAKATLTVSAEVAATPVEKLDVIKRADVVGYALTIANSKTATSEAVNHISVSRTPYTNEVVVVYSTTADDQYEVIQALMRHSVETINKISGYKVSFNDVMPLNSIKSGPSKGKYTVLGAFVGAFLVALFYSLKYVFENKVRDREFIEKGLRLPILGELKKSDDTYISLATNIKYGLKDKKVLSINSFEKEGKKVALKLSKSLVQTGCKVLIIEEKEYLSNTSSDIPALEVLKADNKSLSVGNLDGVDVLSYEDQNQLPILLQSEKFSSELKKLRDAYDYVIFSTPVAESSDATVATFDAESDVVVFVVIKDVTSAKKLLSFKKALELISLDALGIAYHF